MAESDRVGQTIPNNEMEHLFAEAVASVERHQTRTPGRATSSAPPADPPGPILDEDEVVVEIHDDVTIDDLPRPNLEVEGLKSRLEETTRQLSLARARLEQREQDLATLLHRFDEVRKLVHAQKAETEAANARAHEAREQMEVRTIELRKAMERLGQASQQIEGIRRRAQREKDELTRYGMEKPFRALLTVMDNLERAVHHPEISPEALKEGVEITVSQLLGVLRQYGVERIETHRGDPFDPAIHEAMIQVECEDVSPGHVQAVLQKGYHFHERLLRAAMVSVAQAPQAPAEPPRRVRIDDSDVFVLEERAPEPVALASPAPPAPLASEDPTDPSGILIVEDTESTDGGAAPS